jgi:hypothetical protein
MEWRADRMSVQLFDPATWPAAAWPAGRDVERAYLEGIAQAGVSAMVSNVRTEWRALRSDDRVYPVTINHGEAGDSYVCLPHSAYALYARREIELVRMGAAGTLLAPVIGMLGGWLRWAGINRIVHIDNWLLSTNLHGDWDGADLPAIRMFLADRFPDHILAIRSVDPWSSPALTAAAQADGWTMVPSRQIWVTDDLARDWQSRGDTRNDRRLLGRSNLTIETLGEIGPADAARIADLYHQLYVGKYSPLNPVFTPAFVTMTHAAGMIRYRVARAADGTIMAVAGLFQRGDVATPPVVGYDMSRPRAEGLYRLASYLFGENALARGARLNGSAGAAEFKRLRGAHGVIEYWAMHTAHLGARQRRTVALLAGVLERWAVPMMRRRGL